MKRIFIFGCLVALSFLNAQKISSGKWTDLFSYNNILCIREGNGKLVAATENGIFFYNLNNGEITKLSKANGLHEVKISAFDYNAETQTGLVGYTNGTMDVISPDGITYIVDIPLATSYTGGKRINHISITGNQAVISMGYGISVFNLDKKEFGHSTFFGKNGVYDAVKEAVIKDNTVYAITASGIKKHPIDTSMLIYDNWATAASGSFNNIDIENGLISYSSDSQAWFGDITNLSSISGNFSNIQDVTVTPQNILVTDENGVHVYKTSGEAVKNYLTSDVMSDETLKKEVLKFKTGWYSNDNIYAGTEFSGIIDANNKKLLKPDGPYRNNSTGITLLGNNEFLVATGNKDGATQAQEYWTPNLKLSNVGFYYFNGTKWVYPQYFKNNHNSTTPNVFNILDVVTNPTNKNEIFFSNYYGQPQGIYKMLISDTKDDIIFSKILQAKNPIGFTADDNKNLFVNTGQKADYGIYNSGNDSFNYKNLDTVANIPNKPKYYGGFLWIPAPRGYVLLVIDLNKTPTNINDDAPYILNTDNNFPINARILNVTFDKTGTVWVGTEFGLRILSNYADITKNPRFEPIIIEQNGVGEELFRDSRILQIEVDSGDQKWVSVNGGGVFYLSSNGQKTLQHFTKENSPLPNNDVLDIKVDEKTGKVYFVTMDGIVTYQGDVAKVTENFGNVLVYPNPVIYANYQGNVHIKGLAEKTNIRITDAAGNLVHQAVARGGFYDWDLTNKGKRVASGIYFVLMTNEDGTDKATAKIAVVN